MKMGENRQKKLFTRARLQSWEFKLGPNFFFIFWQSTTLPWGFWPWMVGFAPSSSPGNVMAEKVPKINEFFRGWGWFATVGRETHKPTAGKASTLPCLGWQPLTSPEECSVRTPASLTEFVKDFTTCTLWNSRSILTHTVAFILGVVRWWLRGEQTRRTSKSARTTQLRSRVSCTVGKIHRAYSNVKAPVRPQHFSLQFVPLIGAATSIFPEVKRYVYQWILDLVS